MTKKRQADPLRMMPIPESGWLYSARFLAALEAAAVMFAATSRKRSADSDAVIPYVAHLLSVAAIVLEHGGGEDEAIAALLHDTLEDIEPQKDAKATVKAFGPEVYAIVKGCTDGRPGKNGKKAPWLGRKKAYIAALAHEPTPILLVSAADKLHNARAMVADVRTVGEALWARFNAPKDEILWYHRALVTAFRANPASCVPLVDELDRTVTLLERLAAGELG